MPGTVKVEGRKIKRGRLRAVITRADGTVEDLGTVAYYHRNPIIRFGWNIVKLARRLKTWLRS